MTAFMSRFSKWLSVVAIILVTLHIISLGCGKKDEGVIKIGVILPLTGPIAMGGQRALRGIELAIDDYNSTSVQKVVLNVEDSRADPATGLSAIKKLVNFDHVEIIIGDLTSGVTLAMAPFAEKSSIILFAPGASSPDVRDAGDYIFRNWVSDDFDGMVAAKYLYKQLGKRQIAVLHVQNEYGSDLKDIFVTEFSALGGQIMTIEPFNQGESDFRTLLAKLKGLNFDAIYIAGQPKEMGFLVKQMKELGIEALLFSNASVEEKDFQTIAQETATGIFYTSPALAAESTSPAYLRFMELYEKKYDDPFDIAVAHGYDAALILLHCLSSFPHGANSIRDCLYSIKDFDGVTGRTTIDDHGDAIKDLLVKRIAGSDSGSVVIERFVP